MDAERIDRLETHMDRGASALFAAALGYAAYGLLRPFVMQWALVAVAASAAAMAYLLSSRALKLLAGEGRTFALSAFELPHLSAMDELLLTERVSPELVLTDADRLSAHELVLTEADRLSAHELVLTDADRLNAHELLLTDADRLRPEAAEPLVLDDILSQLGPDSRVVRLFDPAAMPTPGQLKGRIDDHLGRGTAPAPPSDAAQALSDALAELRRSLR